jgi:DNA adenine methylase
MSEDNWLLDLEDEDYKPVRCPFVWPGGKSKCIDKICPHLPHRDVYVEPFGGSGAIMLARRPSTLDVYNDRYTGVVAFYKCLRSPKLFEALMERLHLCIHSREDWMFCKESWENCKDDVERAARWYTVVEYSFGGIGRNWGRNVGPKSSVARKVHRKLPLFPAIHERMKNVQIENCGYETMLDDYDSDQTVFYLDPPYIGSDVSVYKHKWDRNDQVALLKKIFDMDGFVALSGYDNPLTDSYPWDKKEEWKQQVSIKSPNHDTYREHSTECLWIKESYE